MVLLYIQIINISLAEDNFGLSVELFKDREHNTEILYQRLLVEPHTLDNIQKTFHQRDPETQLRLKRILRRFYQPAYVYVPIWCLPSKYRYVDDEDISLKYYELARKQFFPKSEDFRHYNNERLMHYATFLFFRDWLTEYRSREELGVLSKEMIQSWKTEHDLTVDLMIKEEYYGNILHKKPPRSVEERLEYIKEIFHFDMNHRYLLLSTDEYFYYCYEES